MPFASIEKLTENFAAEGYLMDRSLATTVFLSNALEKPLFLEGEPGVGKTELAKVLAKILGAELIRLQCYEGLDTSSALYEWNYAKQMLEIRLEEARGIDKQQIGANIFSKEFLLERPLLKAIQVAPPSRAVLLIDEVDRSDEEFEAFLLEVLSEFQISIPEIGTLRASQPPFVVLTSNRTRDLHDALKRRCLYHWIDYPDVEKEIGIVMAQVPGIDKRLAEQLCRFMQWIRTCELYKLPGVAETVDWAKALISLGATELDADTVDATLGCILKFKGDLDMLRQADIAASLPEALGTRGNVAAAQR
jgi:MoxR-like ATPase